MEEMQAKLQTLLVSAEYAEQLPPEGQKRVEQLRALNAKHEELELEYEEARKELERRFHKKYQPLSAERKALVEGEEAVFHCEVEVARDLEPSLSVQWFKGEDRLGDLPPPQVLMVQI